MKCPDCQNLLVFNHQDKEWWCNTCDDVRLDRSIPVMLGACYRHQWSEKYYFMMAASVVEGDDYVELCEYPLAELKDGQFRETWHGSLEEFYKNWYYNKAFDEDIRRSLKKE